jgi:low affinity Fe/Cu permease
MDPILLKIASEAPNLAVLVFIVVIFLKHIRESAQVHTALMKELAEGFHSAHREITIETSAAIAKNSSALDRNTEALGAAGVLFKNGSHAARQ